MPTGTVNRAGEVRNRRSGGRKGLWLAFVLLLVGALTYWYSTPRQIFIDWSKAGDSVSSFASSMSSSASASISSAWSSVRQTVAPERVAVVETPVHPAVSAASQPPVPVPVPAPAPVSRRRDQGAPAQKGSTKGSEIAATVVTEPRSARVAPVDRPEVKPPGAVSAALHDPAPSSIPDAQTVTVSEPASDVAEPRQRACSETLAALALCPK
ncbi:hypothetical protein [Variovorax sp. GT1P44]|uniref:hypothetical protein n=1 Tax=Variovorax sp. GT1P44 TaxID=3443742 RepID=UPI003F45FB47